MTKIYFAPNWGLSPARMLADYLHQSPHNSGAWGGIEATLSPNEADYLIIQDECEKNLYEQFSPSHRLYFSREALAPQYIDYYSPTQVKRCSFWDGSSILWTKWWYPNKSAGGINKTYDELTQEEENPYFKNKLLSSIQSAKRTTWGHALRYNFLENFMREHGDLLDLYGFDDKYCAGMPFRNKELKNNDKFHALSQYKYCFAFDNQDTIKNFFGTQFTDAILYWTVPIYWGGADLQRFFPPGSYIQIDLKDLNTPEQVVNFLKEDDYSARVESLKEARDLILNKYNLWPLIEDIIKNS